VEAASQQGELTGLRLTMTATSLPAPHHTSRPSHDRDMRTNDPRSDDFQSGDVLLLSATVKLECFLAPQVPWSRARMQELPPSPAPCGSFLVVDVHTSLAKVAIQAWQVTSLSSLLSALRQSERSGDGDLQPVTADPSSPAAAIAGLNTSDSVSSSTHPSVLWPGTRDDSNPAFRWFRDLFADDTIASSPDLTGAGTLPQHVRHASEGLHGQQHAVDPRPATDDARPKHLLSPSRARAASRWTRDDSLMAAQFAALAPRLSVCVCVYIPTLSLDLSSCTTPDSAAHASFFCCLTARDLHCEFEHDLIPFGTATAEDEVNISIPPLYGKMTSFGVPSAPGSDARVDFFCQLGSVSVLDGPVTSQYPKISSYAFNSPSAVLLAGLDPHGDCMAHRRGLPGQSGASMLALPDPDDTVGSLSDPLHCCLTRRHMSRVGSVAARTGSLSWLISKVPLHTPVPSVSPRPEPSEGAVAFSATRFRHRSTQSDGEGRTASWNMAVGHITASVQTTVYHSVRPSFLEGCSSFATAVDAVVEAARTDSTVQHSERSSAIPVEAPTTEPVDVDISLQIASVRVILWCPPAPAVGCAAPICFTDHNSIALLMAGADATVTQTTDTANESKLAFARRELSAKMERLTVSSSVFRPTDCLWIPSLKPRLLDQRLPVAAEQFAPAPAHQQRVVHDPDVVFSIESLTLNVLARGDDRTRFRFAGA